MARHCSDQSIGRSVKLGGPQHPLHVASPRNLSDAPAYRRHFCPRVVSRGRSAASSEPYSSSRLVRPRQAVGEGPAVSAPRSFDGIPTFAKSAARVVCDSQPVAAVDGRPSIPAQHLDDVVDLVPSRGTTATRTPCLVRPRASPSRRSPMPARPRERRSATAPEGRQDQARRDWRPPL